MIWATTNPLRIVSVRRKTTDKFLAEFKPGQYIHFKVPIKVVGRGRSGHYAVQVKICNSLKGCNKNYTINQLGNVFDVLELEHD